jgi:hypothetical protein
MGLVDKHLGRTRTVRESQQFRLGNGDVVGVGVGVGAALAITTTPTARIRVLVAMIRVVMVMVMVRQIRTPLRPLRIFFAIPTAAHAAITTTTLRGVRGRSEEGLGEEMDGVGEEARTRAGQCGGVVRARGVGSARIEAQEHASDLWRGRGGGVSCVLPYEVYEGSAAEEACNARQREARQREARRGEATRGEATREA